RARVRLGPDLIALVLEQLAERGANALLVVDHQDAVTHGLRRYSVISPRATRTSPMYSGIVIAMPSGETPSGRTLLSSRASRRGIAERGRERSAIFTDA